MIKNQLKAGALLSYIVLVSGNIINLLYMPFMLRMLGQSQYGLYSLSNTVVGYLAILDFGFGNATIRYTAKYRAEKNFEKLEILHGTFLLLYSVIGFFIFIASVFLSALSSSIFSNGLSGQEIATIKILFILSGLNLAVSFPLGIFSSIITAYERFVFLKICSFIRILINPLVFIPILIYGYRSIGLLIATTILNLFFFMINFFFCIKKLKIKISIIKPDILLLKEIFHYSFWVFLSIIVNQLWWGSGHIFLGIFSTTTAIAIYSLTMQLKYYFETFAMSISSIFLPKLAVMDSAMITNAKMTTVFIKVGRLQYYVLVLLFTGFLLFGKKFIFFWAGNEYASTYYTTLIIFFPLVFIDIQSLGITILQVKNRHAFRAVVYLGIAILCCISFIPLVKKYGPFGCAIGTALALVIGNIFIMNWYYYKKIGLDIPKFWFEILKISPGVILPAIIAIFFLKFCKISNLLELALCIVLYCVLYFLSVYFFSFNRYEKKLVFFWQKS